MATLSSLSTIMPKMLDMAEGYAQSDPILEQVRKKRMEREEQDRKNAETASMNAYRKTEARIKQQQSDLSAQAQQFMATLPPIDNSSNEARAASMRARINGMLNSNIPDVMELGKSLLTAVPQFIQMQQAGGSATTSGERDYIAGTDATRAKTERDRAEARHFAAGGGRGAPPEPTDTMQGTVRKIMNERNFTILSKDIDDIKRYAHKAMELQQIDQGKGISHPYEYYVNLVLEQASYGSSPNLNNNGGKTIGGRNSPGVLNRTVKQN